MNSRVCLILLAFSAVLTIAPTAGTAQFLGRATDGILLPLESTTLFEGARSMEANPAGLGFTDGFDVQLQYTHTDGDLPGEGFGALAGFRLFGGLRMGLSGQYLDEGYGKAGVGLALSPSESFSFGVSYHGLIAKSDRARHDVHTFDAGILVRPASWVSLGASVRDLNAPRIGGVEVPRLYDFGVAFRPGTWRMNLALEASIWEDSGDVDPRVALRGTPIPGFHLGALAQLTPRDGELGVNLGFSIGVNWSLLGLEVGSFVDQPPAGDFAYSGVSAGVQITNQQRLSIHRPSEVWVEIGLSTPSEKPTRSFFGRGGPTQLGILEYLSRIAADTNVAGVVLRYRGFRPNWAQARELRDAIDVLKERGKSVYVYFSGSGTSGYYAAAGADKIMMDPAGSLWPIGLASRVTYFKDLFDWVGVKAQFVRYGKYKSFPESFTETEPSEASLEVKNSILDGIYTEILTAISQGRGTSMDEARAIIDGAPYDPETAKTKGVIDATAYPDELPKAVEELAGRPIRLTKGYVVENPQWEEWGEASRVAVLTIQGSIVEGRSRDVPLLGQRFVGDASVNASLDALRRDPRVRAIVLRIDSPGGSAIASDHIFRKAAEVAKVKPVVVSMGSTAASGGYYIAAAAERIFAEPTTLTGSIGIFYGKFSVQSLLSKIGVSRPVYKRGANADSQLWEVPWTPEQEKNAQSKLIHYYHQFLDVVAEARGKTRDEAHEVAQGRVWLGSQALEVGLVDEMGGLRAAVEYAAKRGGIATDRPIALFHLPRRSFWDALTDLLVPSVTSQREVGAPPDVFAADDLTEPEVVDGWTWVGEALSGELRGIASILPYGDGRPLYLMPFDIHFDTAD